MANGEKFTHQYIVNLKPRDKEYWAREGQGFAVRVYPTGAKAWYYIYTFDGCRRFMRLSEGCFPDVSLAAARKLFNAAKVTLENGTDPQAEKLAAKAERKRTPFIPEFIADFIERYAKEHNRGWREIERVLLKEIVPRWGRMKVSDVERLDLADILDEIKGRGSKVMANRVLAYTRKAFAWGVAQGIIKSNPFLGMSRPNREESRERALGEDEIRAFWHNLGNCRMSDAVKRALKLILVTGQRPGEVIGMHRDEISGDWWEIPAARSKNGQPHRVPLTDLARELIGNASGYIFESPVNPGKSYESRTMTHDIKLNLPHTPESTAEDRLKIPHFRPHDLRRSAATQWAAMGITGDMIDRLQNHITKQKQGVGYVYNRYQYAAEKKLALERWEARLLGIITGNDAVTLLRQKIEAKRRELEALEAELSSLEVKVAAGHKVVSLDRKRKGRTAA